VFNQQQVFVNANIRTKNVTMFGFYALVLRTPTPAGRDSFDQHQQQGGLRPRGLQHAQLCG